MEAGDTPAKIALRYGVDAGEIMAWNDIVRRMTRLIYGSRSAMLIGSCDISRVIQFMYR